MKAVEKNHRRRSFSFSSDQSDRSSRSSFEMEGKEFYSMTIFFLCLYYCHALSDQLFHCLSNIKNNSLGITRVQLKVKKNVENEKSMKRGSVVLSQIWIRVACGARV